MPPPLAHHLPGGDAAAVGAIQVLGGPGSVILFHNALWHGTGPFTAPDAHRVMLYTVYEHPWMQCGTEQWTYPSAFMVR